MVQGWDTVGESALVNGYQIRVRRKDLEAEDGCQACHTLAARWHARTHAAHRTPTAHRTPYTHRTPTPTARPTHPCQDPNFFDDDYSIAASTGTYSSFAALSSIAVAA
eukprot:scaffold78505_cov69-Phaeocystis_antarctica.AAC.2